MNIRDITEIIQEIEKKYEVAIFFSYDSNIFNVYRVRMRDKYDNFICICISCSELYAITIDHFKYRLEEMAKQLLKDQENAEEDPKKIISPMSYTMKRMLGLL